MKMDRLNQWLTLLANVGVLAGIVFLAVETRQTGEAIEQSNRIAISSTSGELFYRNVDWFRVGLDNPHIAELFVKLSASDALTETETVQATFIAAQLAQLWMSSEVYVNRGLIPDDLFAAMLSAPSLVVESWPGLVPFVETSFPEGADRNDRVYQAVRTAIEAGR